MAIPVETNINTVDPNDFTPEGFQAGLGSVIPATTFTGSFYQGVDVVQYYIYDINKLDINRLYKFINSLDNYKIVDNENNVNFDNYINYDSETHETSI